MLTYALFWGGGGLVGMLGGILVLRYRRAFSAAMLVAYAGAALGLVYGAKLQFRMDQLPLLQAFAIPPSQLLTPGYHIPLGLVGGLVFGSVACLLVRVPVAELGDALAVSAAVMIPIGRIGCLLAGCCAGVVCGAWARPICFTFPSGTEAFYSQVDAGLIARTAARSLPAHPLQLYFGGAALAILGVLLALLRAGARPGSMLATGFFLYPLAQLALERIRAPVAGHQTGIMTTVLLGMMLADAAVVAAIVAYRGTHLGMRRAWTHLIWDHGSLPGSP
jgi:prolipoprotein diacylglyceryltransferase